MGVSHNVYCSLIFQCVNTMDPDQLLMLNSGKVISGSRGPGYKDGKQHIAHVPSATEEFRVGLLGRTLSHKKEYL